MSHCAVNGCTNQTSNCKNRNVSFFSLPRNEDSSRGKHGSALKREFLPKKVFICSEHFCDDCFEHRCLFQSEHMSTIDWKKKSLIPGNVPTKLWYKKVASGRPASKRRGKASIVKKVSSIFFADTTVTPFVWARLCLQLSNDHFSGISLLQLFFSWVEKKTRSL